MSEIKKYNQYYLISHKNLKSLNFLAFAEVFSLINVIIYAFLLDYSLVIVYMVLAFSADYVYYRIMKTIKKTDYEENL